MFRCHYGTVLLVGFLRMLLACSEPVDSPDSADAALVGLHQAAAGGNAEAQYQLAMRYVTGDGIRTGRAGSPGVDAPSGGARLCASTVRTRQLLHAGSAHAG